MANTKISALPTYTGDTTGVYLVMDDSSLTQTYKISKEALISSTSGWTIAGTISQVGWSATTTAPTITGYGLPSEVAIWQLTSKQYQLAMTFRTTGVGNTAGSGDYLFTLPSGLQFDTRLGFQTIYSGSVQSNDTTLGKYVIPSGNGMISDGAGSVTTNFMPIVWDATRFRILAHKPGTAMKCIGSDWFETTASIGFTLTFQFTTI